MLTPKLLPVLALALSACAAPDPPERAPADTLASAATARPLPSRDDFLREGLLPIGDSRASLVDTLGEPDSLHSRVVPNRHVPGVQDTLFTLFYPTLTARLHRPGGGRDILAGIEVADNRHLRHPVIGATRARVEEAFGAPDQVEGGRLIFACRSCTGAEEPFELIVENGVVPRVRFPYYVD